jgi:O-antigen ligase
MMKAFQIQSNKILDRLLFGYMAISFIAIICAVVFNSFLPLFIPLVIAVVAYIIYQPGHLYLLLFGFIPFSMDVYLPGGLGTDLPTEPIMWALFGIGILYFLRHVPTMNLSFLVSPGSLLLLLGYGWMLVATIFAEYPIYAFKFSLAKTWYVVVFFYFSMLFFKDHKFYDKAIQYLTISIFVIVLYVLARHGLTGFSFSEAQKVVQPFFSNNVYYASLLVAFLPLLWSHWQNRPSNKILYAGVFALILIAIFLSFKRVALVAAFAAVVWYFVIRLRKTKLALICGAIVLFIALAFTVRNNKFLDFAPRYEKTISHYEFDDLLSATYKGQDVSTMERVYRWVAGYYMFRERPITGFGPTNFYPVYKSYTITPFKTYVSDNPEKSGMHNYFFMLAVEQGLPGVLFFLVFIIYLLLLAEKLYHNVSDPILQRRIMGWGLCIFIVFLISLMNEVIESDKIGPLFFISAALLIWESRKRHDKTSISV